METRCRRWRAVAALAGAATLGLGLGAAPAWAQDDALIRDQLKNLSDRTVPVLEVLPNPYAVPGVPDAGAKLRTALTLPQPFEVRIPLPGQPPPVGCPDVPLPGELVPPPCPLPPPGSSTAVTVETQVLWLPLLTNKPLDATNGLVHNLLAAPLKSSLARAKEPSEQTISAVLTLRADPDGTGPQRSQQVQRIFNLEVPVGRLGLPSFLLLFEKPNFTGPGLLLIESATTAGAQPSDVQGQTTALGRLTDQVNLIAPDFPNLGPPLLGVASVTKVRDLLQTGNVTKRVASEVPNLNKIDIRLGLINNTEAENTISSLIYVAPPGRSVELFNKRDFSIEQGAFRLGSQDGIIAIPELDAGEPPAIEGKGSIFQIKPPTGALVNGFGNELSSIRFVTGGGVGEPRLTPVRARTRVGRTVPYTLRWRHPTNWNDLRTVELRLVDGRRVFGHVRFRQKDRSLGLVGGPSGRAGQDRTLTRGALSLRLGRSSLKTSGPKGRSVTLRLALRLGRAAAGRTLAVEVLASDDDGERQGFQLAGELQVRR